jgi:hypothetical protein
MLTSTVNFPIWRAPSPHIRARDTLNDGAANSTAGVNSAPNVDAGVNSAAALGEQRCGDHNGRGDSAYCRQLAEHNKTLASSKAAAVTTPLARGRPHDSRRSASTADLRLAPLRGLEEDMVS